jgi:S-adenosyl methyltransferase
MAARKNRPRYGTTKSHPARVYDWLLGGRDFYSADQETARSLPAISRDGALQNRAFMRRAVAWAARAGIDQFLDVGAGMPTQPNLHQVAQGINPAARVVYADNDLVVLRHAEALLFSSPEGATDYVHADVREPGELLAAAGRFLDLSRPVGLTLIGLLHFIADDHDPHAIIRTLVEGLAPGSLVTLSHSTADFHPELERPATAAYRAGGIELSPRSRADVERFFTGLDLVEPGVVGAPEWHPSEPVAPDEPSPLLVGMGRVP